MSSGWGTASGLIIVQGRTGRDKQKTTAKNDSKKRTDTRQQGRILAGGRWTGMDFIAPTVVCDLPGNAWLVREEQFAPLILVLAYDTLDEAIARANDSEYGLTGTIWTGDPERGMEVALQVQAGTLRVNKHLELRLDIPFGGSKQSGFGLEQGLEGLQEFTQRKIINMGKAAFG